MGHDAARLRCDQLYGLSAEVKAGVDGRLIHDDHRHFDLTGLCASFLIGAVLTRLFRRYAIGAGVVARRRLATETSQ